MRGSPSFRARDVFGRSSVTVSAMTFVAAGWSTACAADAEPADADSAPAGGGQAADPTPSGGGGGVDELAYSPCREARAGLFRVVLEDEQSSVDGSVAEAVVYRTLDEVVAEEGGCQLIKSSQPLCDPLCPNGQLCTASAECVLFPENVDMGTVNIAGLSGPVEMTPNSTFRYFDVSLSYPGFSPGSDIRLEASGGKEPLSLRGWGIEPLSLTGDIFIEQDKALVLNWVPQEGPANVFIKVNIDQHGSTPVDLSCDVPDTGRAEVPAELISGLLSSGISGFPTARVSRRTADSTLLEPGCVEFQVLSTEERPVGVEGYTPCTAGDPDACPDGLTCNPTREACE